MEDAFLSDLKLTLNCYANEIVKEPARLAQSTGALAAINNRLVRCEIAKADQGGYLVWAEDINPNFPRERRDIDAVLKAQGFVIGLLLGKLEAAGQKIGFRNGQIQNHKCIYFSSLIEFAMALNSLLPEGKKIDLTPLQNEALALISERSDPSFLLAKYDELGKDMDKFKDWADNQLRPNLIAIADAVRADSLKAVLERADYVKGLQSATEPKK